MHLAFTNKDITLCNVTNSYSLLCKAAYAELKANAQSEVTPKNCKRTFLVLSLVILKRHMSLISS